MSQAMQYAEDSGVLFPVGATQPTLAPGFYELGNVHGTYGLRPSKPVSDDLLDIPGTPADEVIQDIERFLATKDRYMRCGLTHKRGYLFYGPPGTGKTSMGLMIARRFIRDVGGVVFHVPSSGHLYHLTNILRAVEPGRPSMFLMEEADSFVNDTIALSILDGEHSLAGAVFVAMTNYKEQMPPRIANRPGRFDRVIYVGAPPRPVQIAYFDRLLDKLDEGHPSDTSSELADALEGLTLSMGHLREAFIAGVLMDVPPEEIRKRFELMAKEGGGDPNPPQPECENGECCECDEALDDDGCCTNSDCDEYSDPDD